MWTETAGRGRFSQRTRQPHEQAALVFYDAGGRPTAEIAGDRFSIGEVAVEPKGIEIGSAPGGRSIFAAGFVNLSGSPDMHLGDLTILPNMITIFGYQSTAYFSSDLIDIRRGEGG